MVNISYLIYQWFKRNFALAGMLMLTICFMVFPTHVRAEENGDRLYDIGLQTGNLFEVDNSHIDNIPMVACYVRRKLNDSLGAVLSLNSYIFDIENTGKILGIPTVEESESTGKTTFIAASLDYKFWQNNKSLRPYVQAGMGVGFTSFDDDDNVSSTGAYDIETDADDGVEVIPMLSIGVRYLIQSRWFLDAGARYDYHISHWKIKNKVSGQTKYINNFSALGAYVGFGIKL